MTWLDWIEGEVRGLLTERAGVLAHWRQQKLTTANRVKNFENWILVELVHRFFTAGVPELKTNGYLDDAHRPSWPRERAKRVLKGVKGSSSAISPDIAFPLPSGSPIVNVEMKTQTASQEVLDDLRLVRFHNENEREPNYHACCVWVVIEPEDPEYQRRVRSSTDKIVERAGREGMAVSLRAVDGVPWLRFAVAAPGMK